jgi:fibronectin type 3 domain-containing protein
MNTWSYGTVTTTQHRWLDKEKEIFGQRLDASGNEVGTNDFRISDMGPDGDGSFDAGMPAVTYNSTSSEYLIVWSGDDNTGALIDEELEIYGQRLNAVGTEVGPNDFRISDMGPDGDSAFDGELAQVRHNTTQDEYLIVWAGDDDIVPLVNGESGIFGQLWTSNIAPATPQNLSAVAGDTQAALTWSPNVDTDFHRYRIYFGTSANPTTAQDRTAQGNANDTTRTITGLTIGSTYFFRITAVDTLGKESGFSTEVSLSIAAVITPQILSGTAGDSQVTLIWSPLSTSNFQRYRIYFGTGANPTTVQDSTAQGNVNDTTRTITGLTNGLTCFFRITAVDTLGAESGFSNEVSATPASPTSITLTHMTATAEDGRVHLSWQVADERDHAGYHIYRSQTADGPFVRLTDVLMTSRADRQYVFIDPGFILNQRYLYRIEAVDIHGKTESFGPVVIRVISPKTFTLQQNTPNPFNPMTTIQYQLAEQTPVRLTIYNISGQMVRVLVDADQTAGFYTIRWDGRDSRGQTVSSGLYIYRIDAGSFTGVRKMIFVK